jgi:hypothetical protein
MRFCLNRLSSRCRTLPSKRLESYVQRPGAPIMLHFQDGTTATCDILIGADGLKSAVRKTMFHEAAMWAESQHRNSDAAELRSLSEPRFSGVFSLQGAHPRGKVVKHFPSTQGTFLGSAGALQTCSEYPITVFYHMQYLGKNRVSSMMAQKVEPSSSLT